MSKEISIIIGQRNEKELLDTIKSIYATAPRELFEIIIIDDFSLPQFKFEVPKEYSEVKMISNTERLGIGGSFDVGAQNSTTGRLFLMGSDLRFNKVWLEKIIEEIAKYPKSIMCTSSLGLNPMQMNMNRKNIARRYGADLLVFHDHKTHPKKPENFRNIFEAKWRVKMEDGTYPIPCILGAAYGVSKEWYNYIDGWNGHKFWGTLEPTISLKSWFFGGDCRVATEVEVGHIFGREVHNNVPPEVLLYNKMRLARVLFNQQDADRLINFLGTNQSVVAARKMISERAQEIGTKRIEYMQKTTIDIMEFFKRFNIEFREGEKY